MTERDDVRRYFSQEASDWLATAYDPGDLPPAYPVGARRARVTLDAVREHLGSRRGRLVDLGCGGGDLCLDAAAMGFEVVGIDVAEGMIEAAETRRRTLAADVAARATFRLGDALASGLAEASADAVTALGLLEYLDEDGPFFREAARVLRPGGVLVVSCRNRLFNLASLNAYTRREIEGGAAGTLLDELGALALDAGLRPALREFLARLRQALPDLEAALALDEAGEPVPTLGFGQPCRQHTPHEVVRAAEARGFTPERVIGIHPHPFPPALEAVAPRFYNRLAAVMDALGAAPSSLAWSSAFVAVLAR